MPEGLPLAFFIMQVWWWWITKVSFILKCLYFIRSWKVFLLNIEFWVDGTFFFQHFKDVIPLYSDSVVSDEMSAAIQTIDPLYEMHGFSLSDFKVLTLCLVFSSLIPTCLRHSFLHLLYSDFAELLKTITYVFVQRWEVFGYHFFKYFSCPILSFLSSGTFRLWYGFICPWGSVNFILLCFFSLSFSDWKFFIHLPSSLLIFSVCHSILILSPSHDFFSF